MQTARQEPTAAPTREAGRATQPEVGEGRRRAVIERVTPAVDDGRFPVKRVVGETVVVEADVFADGHDELGCVVRYRSEGDREWAEAPMDPVENDRWRGQFTVSELGRYRYTVRAWVDRFASWRRDVGKKLEAGQDVAVDLLAGAQLVERALVRAHGPDRRRLRTYARSLRQGSDPLVVSKLLGKARVDARAAAEAVATDLELATLMARYPDRRFAATYDRELPVMVDPERARFSAWYEMFPRSASPVPGRHGTFDDVIARLPYVAGMGFDVLYLPPIHPIGRTHRKGKNNSPKVGPDEPGSPWAIGAEEGGHTAIHPELGTLEDFRRLVDAARARGIHVALDLAYQCSPDHPWAREHPEWFRHRPDGTIQHAENPPKKYEDIYPIDFESEDWKALWAELRRVVEYWIAQGVELFRVDNPHTKAFPFWEWMIEGIKREHPEVILLSEAFTRPRVMYRLAKVGFTQSYTYFAWRTTKGELTEYFTELTQTEVREFFRPNLWPNTPDILTEQLQSGKRSVFMSRLVLAATLGANYGIYGPAYELMEHVAVKGKEEYVDNEKYEIRHWDLDRPDSLADFIGLVNRIRRDHPALQQDRTLRFHHIDNDRMLLYSKISQDRTDAVLVVVNLDPDHAQSGWTHLFLDDIGVIEHDRPFQVHDLLTGSRFDWQGSANYIELDPGVVPAHILHVRSRLRSERDYEHFL